jgi:hypothetical protein
LTHYGSTANEALGHGKPAVVVVAAEEYQRLQRLEIFTNFADHLLGMPTDDGRIRELERISARNAPTLYRNFVDEVKTELSLLSISNVGCELNSVVARRRRSADAYGNAACRNLPK